MKALPAWLPVLALIVLWAHLLQPSPIVAADNTLRQIESRSGHYTVSIDFGGSTPSPGAVQSWWIQIRDVHGVVVQPSRLQLDGGMAHHGHGLPTRPRLGSWHSGRGFELIDVQFSMAGSWQMAVLFTVAGESDRADLQLDVTFDSQPESDRSDTLWTPELRARLRSIALPSQAHEHAGGAAPEALAVLGETLFFDAELSRSRLISCASCHQPGKYFTNGGNHQRSDGVLRNTPTLVGVSRARQLSWDGRHDALWAQALEPLEAHEEFDSHRWAVVSDIQRRHPRLWQAAFASFSPDGAVPAPTSIQQAEREWQTLDSTLRERVNREFARVGLAIATFETRLNAEAVALDRFAEALLSDQPTDGLLSATEERGLRLFVSPRTQCLNCHGTPDLSNHGMHAVGTGPRLPVQKSPEQQRFRCRSALNPVNTASEAVSHWLTSNDALNAMQARRDCNQLPHAGVDAFKVPSLRGVADTAPYLHDGRYVTLDDVLEHYRSPPGSTHIQASELPDLASLSEQDWRDLLAFLKTLTGAHSYRCESEICQSSASATR